MTSYVSVFQRWARKGPTVRFCDSEEFFEIAEGLQARMFLYTLVHLFQKAFKF